MSVEDKAARLLGAGISQSAVAAACGVTEGRISQLMADEAFSSHVASLRQVQLAKHIEIDESYDDIEKAMLEDIKKTRAFLKPMEKVKVLQVVNQAKRRTTAADVDTAATSTGPVVNISMPTILINKLTANVNNQILEVSDEQGTKKSLITANSTKLEALIKQRNQRKLSEKGQAESKLDIKAITGKAITAEDL